MKKGFTLTELLTTIVILAVLAAIALPSFSKSAEKAKARQAVVFLRTIRTGEKMYFAKNNSYWACPATPCTKVALETNLGAEVSMADYAFGLTANATTFSASASKGTAVLACGGADTICVDQAGVWTSTSSHVSAVKLNS